MFILHLFNLFLVLTQSITINLNATEKGQLFISLNWLDREQDQYPTFRVFRSRNGEPFQSISTIDLEKGEETVTVLNVYPVTGTTTKYFYLNGTEIAGLTDQSAGLKVFMEGGYNKTVAESNKFLPYGQVQVSNKSRQLIQITPVTMQAFNTNPKMIWNYDVVMFGSWDDFPNSNGGVINYPLNASLDEIDAYYKAGYGVLMGHDSVTEVNKGFGRFAPYLGIELKKMDFYYHSTKVKMTRKGTLSQYPWELGEQMIIPPAHTTCQFAQVNDDVWFEFMDGYITPTGANYSKAMSYGNAVFYLTSTNNIAMIQTGHSCGLSSSDERKILANTLFYLKQRSSNTYVNDFNVVDDANPDPPIEISKSISIMNAQRQLKLSLKLRGKDNGAAYDYQVHGYNQLMVRQYSSGNSSISVISGLRHFAYLFDDKATATTNNLLNSVPVQPVGASILASKNTKKLFISDNTNNQDIVNGIVEGEATIEITDLAQYKPASVGSFDTFTMYLHVACVDNNNLTSTILNIPITIDLSVTRPEATTPPATTPPATTPPATIPPATIPPATTPAATIPPSTIPPFTTLPPSEETTTSKVAATSAATTFGTTVTEVVISKTATENSNNENDGRNAGDYDGSEQNKGNSGKKDNTGTIIGAVVGAIAGLAGAAAAATYLINASKPPIPISPYWGTEEEEEEEDVYELNFDLYGNQENDESNNNSDSCSAIQNEDEIEPYANEV